MTKTIVYGRRTEDNDASIRINGRVLENVDLCTLAVNLRGTTIAQETFEEEYTWQRELTVTYGRTRNVK